MRNLALLILTSCIALHAHAEVVNGRVTRVIDGDTVVIKRNDGRPETVRLQAIDAPEKRQTGGAQSKEHLRQLTEGKRVTVETKGKDKYGRTVGKVSVNGKDAGLEQVKSGDAIHYKKYEKGQAPKDRAAYSAADKKAPKANNQTPEQFRKQQK